MAAPSLARWALGWDLPVLVQHSGSELLIDDKDDSRDEEIKIFGNWPNDLGFDVIREERMPIDLPVHGHIPAFAAGSIYRNGPGASNVQGKQHNYKLSHWFDGFGQIHKFEIIATEAGDVRIRYTSRYHVDSLLESIRETGVTKDFSFAQKRDPCISFFRKVMTLFEPTPPLERNFTNVGITVTANTADFPQSTLPEEYQIHHASGLRFITARTDQDRIKALDANTLEPIGIAEQKSLHPLLKGPMSSAHAKSDPVTGDIFNWNLEISRYAIYRVFRVSAATRETEILATISHPEVPPAYIHSFFLTENYVVLCVWGGHLAAGGLKVLWERNVLDAISPFDASQPAHWFVVDRRFGRGVVARFQSSAFFCFHTINAWERKRTEGEEVDIICDLIAYDNLDILHKFYYDNLRSSSRKAAEWMRDQQSSCEPYFARFVLEQVANRPEDGTKGSEATPVREAHLTKRIPSPKVGDVPTMNPKYVTKQNRFFYTVLLRSLATFFDALAKVDVETGEITVWETPGHTPGEAIFIADPHGTEEDDGVLLSVVLDGPNATSYLLCLDAKTMKEVGRADCKGPLAFSFHGQYVRDGEIPVSF